MRVLQFTAAQCTSLCLDAFCLFWLVSESPAPLGTYVLAPVRLLPSISARTRDSFLKPRLIFPRRPPRRPSACRITRLASLPARPSSAGLSCTSTSVSAPTGTAPHPLRLAVLCRERPREFAAACRVLQQNRAGADWSSRAPSSPAAQAHAPSARWCREARALSASPRSSHLLLDLYRFSCVCSGTQRCSRFWMLYLHPTDLLHAISSANTCAQCFRVSTLSFMSCLYY